MPDLPRFWSPDDQPEETVVRARRNTREMPPVVRAPATSEAERDAERLARFPIAAGCLLGAPTDVIAESISRGCKWTVGPAVLASGHTVIWLLGLEVPYRDQLAAWWVAGPGR